MSMFSKTISVLYISRTRIRAARVFLDEKNRVEAVMDDQWNSESLGTLLEDACSRIGSDTRIVLADDLSYVVNLPLPKSTPLSRDVIRNEAQGCIPEDMERVVWDFGVLNEESFFDASGPVKTVQVMAASEFFLENIVPAVVRAGFTVDAIEAEACALARLIGTDKEPLLLVHDENDGSHLLFVSDHGIVRTTERIVGLLTVSDIEKTALFAKNRYGQDMLNISFSGKSYDGLSREMEKKGFRIKTTVLDPCVGIALKTDIEGSDRDVLNMDMLPKGAQNQRIKRSEKRLLRIFVVVFLSGAVAIAGILAYRKKTAFSLERKVQTETASVSIPSQEVPGIAADPSTVPENSEAVDSAIPIDVSSYRVSVFNGGGEKGAAGKLKSVLEENGFSVGTIGNAPGVLKETSLEAKISVSEEARKALIDTIRPMYLLSPEIRVLDESDDNDIIVTIGSEKTTPEPRNLSVEAQHN